MSNSSLLKTESLYKSYLVGSKDDANAVKIDALKNINIEINQGEFLSIVGKSGSGKSTLMHIIGLLDTPTSGNLFINKINVTTMNEKELARIRNKEIGFVFQSFNLLSRASALDNVVLPLKYSTTPKHLWEQKANALLDLVGLSERKLNKSNELSGGQKQRVAIARALVNDPSIILADEPTGNLDSKTGKEIMALFTDLHKQGKTIIIVTHDNDIAMQTNRQIVISDGEILDSGAKQ